MATSNFIIVGQANGSSSQRVLCELSKYANDGVEGLGWTVAALGSTQRYHSSELRMAGCSLNFVDHAGQSCRLSFVFKVTTKYRIERFLGRDTELVEEGDVLFGVQTLRDAAQGKLFTYIQTPD